MRKKFPGYFRLTESEFLQLWENCLFAFDTNVLNNLYRYTPETKDSFINIMRKVSNRIWLPYQVAFEYLRGRISIILKQSNAYDEIQIFVKKGHDALSKELKKYRKHPSIHINGILEKSKLFLTEIEDTLTQLKKNHPDLMKDDPIQSIVLKLFDGKVGNAFSREELLDIYKQGEERYKLKIPPGYDDKDKAATDKYGDLVIWFQLIAKAKENKLPMILVTDDRKEDWWLKIKGKVIGPHPELVQEFSAQTGVTFYMYSPDPFMEHAGKYLKYKVEKKAIKEVRDVRHEDEIVRQAKKKEDLMRSIMGYSGYSGVSESLMKAREEALRSVMGSSSAFESSMKAKEEVLRSIMGSSGYSGVSESLMKAREEALRSVMGSSSAFESSMKAKEEVLRSIMGSSGYSGVSESLMKAREEALRSVMGSSSAFESSMKAKEEALRSIMGSSGYSGVSKSLMKAEEEALMRSLTESPGYTGTATDEFLRQAHVTKKPEKKDSSDIGKKDK